MGETEEPEVDLREWLHVLVQYKWLILGVMLAIIAAGIVWTLRVPKIYEATVTLEYDPNPSRPLGSNVEDIADPIGNFWTTREFFQTQNMVIASRDVATRATRSLGLHEDPGYLSQSDEPADKPAELAQVAMALQSRISVDPVPETRLVRIHARDVKPERARLVADAVANAYIDKTMEDRLSSTVKALDWLGNQLDTLRGDLDTAELALHDFKKDHEVLSVSMEDRQNLVASDIQATNSKLTEVRNRRIELAARVQRLRSSLKSDDSSAVDPVLGEQHPVLAELTTDLRAKQKELKGLSTKYGPEHPTMKTLEGEVGSLKAQLKREKATLLKSAEDDLKQAKSVETGLRGAAKQAQSAGLDLNLREIEYRRLNRERDNKAKLYELVLQRLAETDLTRMLKITHVRILDRALLPTAPVSPNFIKNLGGSALAGMLLGIALAFVARRLDRTVKSVEAVEALGVTVLGVVPKLGGGEGAETTKPRPVAGGEPLAPGQAVHDLVVHENPMSAAAESFRMIRTNLAFMSPEEPLRSIVVTSAHPREGKTTVASNLAVSFAQFGRSVLLVDTDLRRPKIHKVFNVSKDIGVSSLIVGHATLDDAVTATDIAGLHVLPSGPVPPNPSELLHSSGFTRVHNEMLERYEWVVFDSPPLSAVADAAILAPQMDGVVLVARAGHTTRDSISSVRRQLGGVSAAIVGTVLNDVDVRAGYGTGPYYYQYRYGGYRYGPEEDEADAA